MEDIKTIDVEDSSFEDEEIFFGPVTKREMMLKLKHYNLCSDELLEPLQKFQDSDVLDDNLIFYYEDVFPKGNTSDEDKWISRCTESSTSVLRDQTINDSYNNIESKSTEVLYKDSLDLSDRKSLSESQLLKKYTPSKIFSESDQLLNSTKNKSILELEEPCNELDQIYHDSLNIQYLNLDNESMSLNSATENSASVFLNSLPKESKSFSPKSTPDKCEIVSLNSTLENSESISLNSTPRKSECLSSYNPTPEKCDTSYSNSNDQSGFNCTLEEMEMLMKFGENYMNESKDLSIKSVDERLESESEKENYSPMSQVYSEDKRSPFKPKENLVQTEILATGKLKENNKLISKQLHTNTPKQHCYESPSPFKLPTVTISKKSPALSFKNIKSPVAMYIKSTSRVPLVQNVSKKTVHAATFRETHSTRLEADECIEPVAAAVLPARSYRPAGRAVLLSRQPEPTLPGSLRRLIRGPLVPEVIRHVGRVASVPETCEPCAPVTPSASAPDQDLTMLSSSLVQGDVSVYVSTNAARTTHLQHT